MGVQDKKYKPIVPLILGIMLIISIVFNGWLYSQLSYINSGITTIQVELSDTQKEYEALLLDIKNGNESLLYIQEENSRIEQAVNQQTKEVLLLAETSASEIKTQPQQPKSQQPQQPKPQVPALQPQQPSDNYDPASRFDGDTSLPNHHDGRVPENGRIVGN